MTKCIAWNFGSLVYQSLFTNTLVEHAYTKIHKVKNKHGVKKPKFFLSLSQFLGFQSLAAMNISRQSSYRYSEVLF